MVYLSGSGARLCAALSGQVAHELLGMMTDPDHRFWDGIATTLQRAVVGYLLALVIGTVIGLAVARVSVLRRAVGSLITGLQTMPSIAWFPFAILVFDSTRKRSCSSSCSVLHQASPTVSSPASTTCHRRT